MNFWWPCNRNQPAPPVAAEPGFVEEGEYYLRSDGVIVGPMKEWVSLGGYFAGHISRDTVYNSDGINVKWVKPFPPRGGAHLVKKVKAKKAQKPSTWTVKIFFKDGEKYAVEGLPNASDADSLLNHIKVACRSAEPVVTVHNGKDSINIVNPYASIKYATLVEIPGDYYLAEDAP